LIWITTAFMQAGGTALVSIALMLWLTLRRISDVLVTLIPLLVAGVVTLEICVAIGLPLNFANVIALPLLLGVGVAFKIYYIMAWRAGQTGLLQSSLDPGHLTLQAEIAIPLSRLYASMARMASCALASASFSSSPSVTTSGSAGTSTVKPPPSCGSRMTEKL
jgi:hypothetical protein